MFLTKLKKPLDVIIDDAVHHSLPQQKTLGILFSQLKEGGMYIIEDLNFSSYKEKPTATLPTILFLLYLANKDSKTLKMKTPIPHDEIDRLIDEVESINFFDSASYGPESFAVITKRSLR